MVTPVSGPCGSGGGEGGVHPRVQTETEKPHEDPTRHAGRVHSAVHQNNLEVMLVLEKLNNDNNKNEHNMTLQQNQK